MKEFRVGRKGEAIYEQQIPIIKSKHPSWCGYATTGMGTQSLGYAEVTPEKIFEKVHNETYNEQEERSRDASETLKRRKHPGATHLAAVVTDLTDLEVRVYDKEKYEKLQVNKPNITPFDVLHAQFFGNDARLVLRLPYHFNILKRITLPPGEYGDAINDATYTCIDPMTQREITRNRETLDRYWGEEEKGYPEKSARHLMLAMYKKK